VKKNFFRVRRRVVCSRVLCRTFCTHQHWTNIKINGRHWTVRREDTAGSGRMGSIIFNFSAISRWWVRFTFRPLYSRYPLIRRLGGPRAGLPALKKNLLFLPGIKPRFFGCPDDCVIPPPSEQLREISIHYRKEDTKQGDYFLHSKIHFNS